MKTRRESEIHLHIPHRTTCVRYVHTYVKQNKMRIRDMKKQNVKEYRETTRKTNMQRDLYYLADTLMVRGWSDAG